MVGGEVELARDLQALGLGLDAVELDAVVEHHALAALELPEEVEMPPGAAELAVGGELQADLLLLPDDLPDLLVLDRFELVGRDLALLALGARVLERRGAQQAADFVGARRARSRPTSSKPVEAEIKKIIRRAPALAADRRGFRRSWWRLQIFWKLEGCERRVVLSHGIQFTASRPSPKVTGKLDFPPRSRPHARAFPSYQGQHQRHDRALGDAFPRRGAPSHGRGRLSDMGGCFDDLAKLYGKAMRKHSRRGCRYLQLDDTVWAYLCSEGAWTAPAARTPTSSPASMPRSSTRR